MVGAGVNVATDIRQLKPIKIRFRNAKAELKGYELLLNSGMPVHATADDRYIINELQCAMLKKNDVDYIREPL